MGFFNRRNRNKLVNTPATVDDTVSTHSIESNTYQMYRLISQLRDVSQTRNYKYAEYDIMATDVVIDAALNMYADDSTQVDENSGQIFTIDSNDENLKKDLSTFLFEKLNIQYRLRDISFALSKYGNKYLKIYLTSNGKDIDHVEEIDDPSTVLDLWYQGEPTYFAEDPDDRELYKNSDEFNLYNHDSFIHFYVHSGDESDIIEFEDHTKIDEKTGEFVILKYKILEGRSLIEGVRSDWRIIRALEDSLLAARLAKADFVRVFNIEVGDSSSSDTRLMVNKVKKIFDSSVSINVRDGAYQATKTSRAYADPIFNSVSHGQGAITIENVGGDFEVKSIVDIDYFNNKLFAGLRIPKTLMGFEESINGGLSNESTLVQLDIRYGKYVKKVIDALAEGLTELCNIWLKLHGREKQIGKFKIMYTSPSSSEEFARLQELAARVAVVAQLTDTIASTSTGVNRVKLIDSLLDEFIPYPKFLEKVRPILKEAMDAAEKDVELADQAKEDYLDDLESNPNPELPTPDRMLDKVPTTQSINQINKSTNQYASPSSATSDLDDIIKNLGI